MTLPRSAAEVLSEHVIFAVECIDRVYLNLYQPWLQHELGVIGYLHDRLERRVNSTAPLAQVSEGFAAAIHGFLARQRVPLVAFTQRP